MLGTPIAQNTGFTYRQQSIPLGTIPVGATWQQLNSSGVPILEYVFDGNFWRITGGLHGRSRDLEPGISIATLTGSVSSSTPSASVGVRKFALASGSTGTGKAVYNSLSGTIQSPFGKADASGNGLYIDFSKPIEILTSVALTKTGFLRWYLLSNQSLSASSNLDGRGFGVLLNLLTGEVTLHLHNGTTLFTQSGGTLSWWALVGSPFVGIELCWDGVSRLGLYINGVYITAINQAITGSNTVFRLHLAFDQPSAAATTQFIDHHYIQTIGGF